MRLVRLWWGIVQVALQREAAHRANLIFQGVVAIAEAAAGLFALDVVYQYAQTLAGWQLGEAIMLLGIFQVVTGLLNAFVQPNLQWFAGKVTNGELDHTLLLPAPSLFMASLGSCEPWALAQSLVGCVLIGVGIMELGGGFNLANAGAAAMLLGSGVVIAWASRVVLASIAFWSPGVDPTVLYGAFWQLGRYPTGIYTPFIRRLLTYVIPVALIATIPTRTLTHGIDAPLLATGAVAALVAILLTRWIWQRGLRRYTGATS